MVEFTMMREGKCGWQVTFCMPKLFDDGRVPILLPYSDMRTIEKLLVLQNTRSYNYSPNDFYKWQI